MAKGIIHVLDLISQEGTKTGKVIIVNDGKKEYYLSVNGGPLYASEILVRDNSRVRLRDSRRDGIPLNYLSEIFNKVRNFNNYTGRFELENDRLHILQNS